MFTKFYWTLWMILALATVVLFAVGSLGWFAVTVVGFISCLLIFMGIMCVTPTIVGPHAEEFQHDDAEPVTPKPRAQRTPVRERFARTSVGVQDRHAH